MAKNSILPLELLAQKNENIRSTINTLQKQQAQQILQLKQLHELLAKLSTVRAVTNAETVGNNTTGLNNSMPNEQLTKLINFYNEKKGTVWKMGANGNGAFDCSSFVQAAYNACGVDMPRTTLEMGTFVKDKIICSKTFDFNIMKPGDLILFTGTQNRKVEPSHCGIYIGNGKMIHCSKSKGVAVADLSKYTLPIHSVSRPSATLGNIITGNLQQQATNFSDILVNPTQTPSGLNNINVGSGITNGIGGSISGIPMPTSNSYAGYLNTLEAVEKITGVPKIYTALIAAQESGFNAKEGGTGSIRGLVQISNDNLKDSIKYVSKYGLTLQNFDKMNPVHNLLLLSERIKVLKTKLNRDPNVGEAYLDWFLPALSKQNIAGNGDKLMTNYYKPTAGTIKANGPLLVNNPTINQVKSRLETLMSNRAKEFKIPLNNNPTIATTTVKNNSNKKQNTRT